MRDNLSLYLVDSLATSPEHTVAHLVSCPKCGELAVHIYGFSDRNYHHMVHEVVQEKSGVGYPYWRNKRSCDCSELLEGPCKPLTPLPDSEYL